MCWLLWAAEHQHSQSRRLNHFLPPSQYISGCVSLYGSWVISYQLYILRWLFWNSFINKWRKLKRWANREWKISVINNTTWFLCKQDFSATLHLNPAVYSAAVVSAPHPTGGPELEGHNTSPERLVKRKSCWKGAESTSGGAVWCCK